MYLLWLLLICLSGCVPIPPEDGEYRISATPSLEPSIEKGREQGVLDPGDFPSPEWWLMFEDPQLSWLIEKGLYQNPTLHEVMARVKKAYEEAKIERSALFPTVLFHAEANWQHLSKNSFFRAYAPNIPPNVTEYKIDLDFVYEFDFWGKWRNLYYASIGKARAECAEAAQAQLMISTAIAAVYFALQADFEALQLLREEQNAAATLVELRKRREKHAIDTIEETLFAEELLLTIDQWVLLSKLRIDLEIHLLRNLIGEGPNDGPPIEPVFFSGCMKVSIPEHLSSNLLAHRPDLMAEIWRIEAAAYEIGAAKADFYPNVNLCALAGLDSVFLNQLFQPGSYAAAATPALYLPIFTAGRLKANLQAKRAEWEKSIFRYNKILFDAVKEVADQIARLTTADQHLILQQALVDNRRRNLERADERLHKSLGNILEVIEAKLSVLQQQLREVEAHYECRLAAIYLIKALGGGYESPCPGLIPLRSEDGTCKQQ